MLGRPWYVVGGLMIASVIDGWLVQSVRTRHCDPA